MIMTAPNRTRQWLLPDLHCSFSPAMSTRHNDHITTNFSLTHFLHLSSSETKIFFLAFGRRQRKSVQQLNCLTTFLSPSHHSHSNANFYTVRHSLAARDVCFIVLNWNRMQNDTPRDFFIGGIVLLTRSSAKLYDAFELNI
jgi:hypothetical protein